MNKINPMLDYNYLEEFDKFEVVCTCSNVFYVDDLKKLNNKSRCPKCENKKVKIEKNEIDDLVIKFTKITEKRLVNA